MMIRPDLAIDSNGRLYNPAKLEAQLAALSDRRRELELLSRVAWSSLAVFEAIDRSRARRRPRLRIIT